MPIEDYIKTKVKNIHDQNERIKAREKDSEKLDQKLITLFDMMSKKPGFSQEAWAEAATNLMMAHIFGRYFFDELDKREDEWIEEAEAYDKLSIKEIEELPPIKLAELIQDYIEKKNLFAEE